MRPLVEVIVKHVPPPEVNVDGPFQMQVSSLAYSSYVGAIGIGRITQGSVKATTPVVVVDRNGQQRQGRVLQVLGFHGLERIEVREATAGDIIAVTGIEDIRISDTLCDPKVVEAFPPLSGKRFSAHGKQGCTSALMPRR
jgi:GTP-binding protein